MQNLNSKTLNREEYPVKILQFGEGNFLRAFVDWMINKANKEIDFNKGVVIVQPLENGLVPMLKEQDCLYHVKLEGVKDGNPITSTEVIDCVQDAINPYSEYEKYQQYFLSPDLELVVSNTTEAGISRVENEDIYAKPPKSFPGKVCQLLYQRYEHFNGAADKGVTFFCCELIEKNADALKEIVFELAEQNNLGEGFTSWLNENCHFCSTLVDRIVTGFPKDNIKEIQSELGYEDNLVVVGEYFHLWAIEAPQVVREKFPFDKAGLHVVWLDDMTQFRDKKVRILNGSHSAMTPVGLLSGHQTVMESFNDKLISDFIQNMVSEEVSPNIAGDPEALKQFADEILERFYNPYIKHYLKDISLNSTSKWITRDLPSVIDSLKRTGELPKRLTFSMAALLVFYKGEYNGLTFSVTDTPEYVEFIQNEWQSDKSTDAKVEAILSNQQVWGVDLKAVDGFVEKVTEYVNAILNDGIKTVLEKVA
ncbi:tagaturonate reductase [Carboxylicivirga linearis]|uniref:Tagaturonate reductase n=1 Tax=Carboxylicivirga linearis TaxID=1628157 RepID=A0ABS5JU45_9BACT|nr:tagaturonate reductase [Carboxylicivirga linearis]MBS2098425.1 tagaturonate reductase [Carboxylicivirga linearis]